MPKITRTVVIEHPRLRRIRSVRIRPVFIAVGVVIVLAGFAGYLIPFNRFALDIVEQNQKRNLREQNSKLTYRVKNLHKAYRALNEKTAVLQAKRGELIETIDGQPADGKISGKSQSALAGTASGKKVDLDQLVALAVRKDRFFSEFMNKLKADPRLLYKVPVLHPVERKTPISAGFGKRRDPFTGTVKWHYGIDFIAEQGTPIRATASGTVSAVEDHNTWGRRLVLSHEFGFRSVYAHLGTVNVRRGKKVKRGDIIATVGVSGLSSGPHLHYEVRNGDTPIDPARLFFPGEPPAPSHSADSR